jgi:class 3 adenylate cyclase
VEPTQRLPPAAGPRGAPAAVEAVGPPRTGLDARAARGVRRAAQGLRRALARSVEAAEPFMVTAGVLGLCGQPLFYGIWRYVFPQPYESLGLRIAAGLICLPAIFKRAWPERLLPYRAAYWVLGVFCNIPLLFGYFLLRNGQSEVWLLSMVGGAFVLTFLVEFYTAIALYAAGAVLALAAHLAAGGAAGELPEYLRNQLIVAFPLLFGGVINLQLQRYRTLQRNFERRLRNITTQHARVVREQNDLLSRFLSNLIVSRLRKFQHQHGLQEAIAMITRQEQRFCGIMQADVRNFTRMFGEEPEIEVARLIRRCYAEITEIGQDLAVIKPVGDSIFVYTDDEQGRQNAVFTILSLAIFFVHSLEKVNRQLAGIHAGALNFGIGIHAGEVVYGNLASDTLIDPTIIGIHVNKAARLEELTKAPALRSAVGANAIICSDEIAFYGSNFIRPEHLLPLELKPMGLALRDFPQVERVFALRGEAAELYVQQAQEHIREQRARFSMGVTNMEASTHHGVPYYYEMQGLGPNATWLALIDVSALPPRTVASWVQHAPAELACEINPTDGQWLIVSTRDAPGELDEVDLEARIFRIIEGLEQALGHPAG